MVVLEDLMSPNETGTSVGYYGGIRRDWWYYGGIRRDWVVL